MGPFIRGWRGFLDPDPADARHVPGEGLSWPRVPWAQGSLLCRNIHSDITVLEHKEHVTPSSRVCTISETEAGGADTPQEERSLVRLFLMSPAAILLILMMSEVMGKKPGGEEDIEGKVLDLGESIG